MIKAIFKKYQKLELEDTFQGVRCKVCNGIVIVTTRQTRSADEGMTVFYICTKCNVTKKNRMACASTKISMRDAIDNFNDIEFTLDIQTTKPSLSIGMLCNQRQDPDANIISVEYWNLDKRHMRNLETFEWPDTSITLHSEYTSKTYELKRQSPLEILDFICDFEKESRQKSKGWYGGIDTHHIYFSGLTQVTLKDGAIGYSIDWNS